jgi:23S rRNA (adenine2503-C2)-methyltransferase
MKEAQTNIFGMTLIELKEVTIALNLPTYTARQLAEWMYRKHARSFEAMTNISKTARAALEKNYCIHMYPWLEVKESIDGTRKYLFETTPGKYIETALIPETKRNTLCVSSQVGCKMGCLFCMTGKQGFQAHLSAGDIINQFHSIPEREDITNIVYMGMGEPMDNIDNVLKSLEVFTSDYAYGKSSSRFTVSTIGILPAVEKFLNESQCHLAISLHSPFDEERSQLMPIEHVYPVQEIVDLLRKYRWDKQRRVSFEYIMFNGLNDSSRHVKQLCKLLNGLRCRVNLIRFHEIDGIPFTSSPDDTITWFKNELSAKGILTTIRASRGQDISAACGLLSTKKLVFTSPHD